jgi:hypothetical protein
MKEINKRIENLETTIKDNLDIIGTDIQGNWQDRLNKVKEIAADKLIKLINNSNPHISLKACELILQLDKINLNDGDFEQGGIQFEGWDEIDKEENISQ